MNDRENVQKDCLTPSDCSRCLFNGLEYLEIQYENLTAVVSKENVLSHTLSETLTGLVQLPSARIQD